MTWHMATTPYATIFVKSLGSLGGQSVSVA